MFLFVGMLFIRLVGRAKEKSRQFDSEGKISLNRIKIGWGMGGQLYIVGFLSCAQVCIPLLADRTEFPCIPLTGITSEFVQHLQRNIQLFLSGPIVVFKAS